MQRFSLFFALLLPALLQAQDFKIQTEVHNTAGKGFKRISLSPMFEGYLQPDCSDLRLYDASGKEVPYFLYADDAGSKARTERVEFKQLSKNILKGRRTEIVFENSLGAIDHFLLSIKNAEVNKYFSLEGSSDQKTWYSVKESFSSSLLSSPNQSSAIMRVDFPISDYRFFRITINDSLSAPLNVLKAYFNESYVGSKVYNEMRAVSIFQNDSSDKKTYLKINFDQTYRLDAFALKISAPEFYKRNASIVVPDTIVEKRKKHIEFREVGNFVLNTEVPGFIPLDGFKSGTLYLIIDNQDNPPLVVDACTGSASKKFLIAHLNANETYFLKGGNDSLMLPHYDIDSFVKGSRDSLELLKTVHQQLLQKPVPDQEKDEKSFFTDTTVIWIALAGVGVLLLLVSAKMLKEMGKK